MISLSDNRLEGEKPKQPRSAYFYFSQEERVKVKADYPNYSICEIAKELGQRWADMQPDAKRRYQQMTEEDRQKYDQEMVTYRQANLNPVVTSHTTSKQAGTSKRRGSKAQVTASGNK